MQLGQPMASPPMAAQGQLLHPQAPCTYPNPQIEIEIEITDNSLVSILDVVLRGRLVGVLLPPSEAQVLRS